MLKKDDLIYEQAIPEKSITMMREILTVNFQADHKIYGRRW